MQGDWVTATATIIGAIIGIVGTLITEHFRRERKSARFVIEAPEDLAAGLRSRGSSFELRVNQVSTQTLNAASVTVQNTGNVIINDFAFDVSVSGNHQLAQAQPSSENPKLASEIQIAQAVNPIVDRQHEPFFVVTLPYFNPGEIFKVTMFYDGDLTRCTINCRLPGLNTKVTSAEDVQRITASADEATKLVLKVGVTGIAGLLTALAAAIAAMLAGH
jgi:hypothetical protein